jgi:hypothetical protein
MCLIRSRDRDMNDVIRMFSTVVQNDQNEGSGGSNDQSIVVYIMQS